MFDTYVVRPGDQHHSHHHEVHEHRAPTDESVKLLSEMEREALKRLLFSVRIENCPVDAAVHALRSPMTPDTKFIIQYKINGAQRRVEHEFIDRGEAPDRARERCMHELVEALALEIAIQILREPLNRALSGRLF